MNNVKLVIYSVPILFFGVLVGKNYSAAFYSFVKTVISELFKLFVCRYSVVKRIFRKLCFAELKGKIALLRNFHRV